MKSIAVIVLFCALCGAADAQSDPLIVSSIQSALGQFVVFGRPSSWPKSPRGVAAGTNDLSLDPTFLAVFSERIKEALRHELDIRSAWRGKIYLKLHPAQGPDETITVVSEQFKDGWNYHLELPDTVERTRFIRVLVNVLLLEMANQNATAHPAEIPLWLSEGLTQQLLDFPNIVLISPAPRRLEMFRSPVARQTPGNGVMVARTTVDLRKRDEIETAQREQREYPRLLTLEELSWPSEESFNGDAGEVYHISAKMFVSKLLQLKDGRVCMREMLAGLGQCYNWQTAFFRAFHAHFERQLDLEKWWALQVVDYTGHDPSQTWTSWESWLKLDEILRTPVQVRRSAGNLPEHAEVPLQTVIRDWDRLHQVPTLRAKLIGLNLARLRMSQESVSLVDDYRQVLAGFVEKRAGVGATLASMRRTTVPMLKTLVRDTLEQLDALEARRQALRPETGTTSAVPTKTNSAAPP